MSFTPIFSKEIPWIFIQFFNECSNAIEWLFPKDPVYSADEAGEIMRRILAQKNWFDNLSTFWVEQPVLTKLIAVTGLCLSFGLIGWAVGAAVILPIVVLSVSIATHCIFVAHHHQRIMNAKIIVAEIIELTKELKKSKQLFDEMIQTVDMAACELKNQGHSLSKQSQEIKEEAQLIKKQKAELDILVKQIQDSTQNLLEQQNKSFEGFKQVDADLNDLDTTVIATTHQVEKIGDATIKLTQSVNEIQKSQKLYSESASRFSLFVSEQSIPKVSKNKINYEEINAFNALLEENDLLIEQMKKDFIFN